MEDRKEKVLLVVDDEPSHLDSLVRIFTKEGYHVLAASDGRQALELLRHNHVDVLLTDLVMPGMDGHELLRACKTISPETEVVVMTAFGSIESAVEAMKEGAYDFVTKPLKKVFISKVVRQALEKQKLMLENRMLRRQLEDFCPHEIVGRSPAMMKTLQVIRQAAPSSATVLLQGESGTGKELLARALHRWGSRAGGPFVAVNCAALPEGILESELFGYEKGAFTGADRLRKGRFEAANGGTLFLDEIGDLSPSTQVKLLRVLQEGEFERLGSSQTLKVDFRLVAATNQDLERKVASGEFRKDLFYRLNVITVRVPPLRERSGDVVLLANFFLKRYASREGKNIKALTARALDALSGYSWPGNVRELENVIERAVVLSTDDVIDLDDLPAEFAGEVGDSASGPVEGRGVFIPVGTSLEEAERRLLLETLKATGGDKNLAAHLLGVATRTIYRKLDTLKQKNGGGETRAEDEAKQ